MLVVDPQANLTILKLFNKSENEAENDLQTIKNWLQTQNFPEIIEDVKIRNYLRLNKYDLERTKERITGYYTMRSQYPEFFTDSNPKSPNILKLLDTMYLCPHPKSLEGLHRVIFMKTKEPNVLTPTNIAKLSINIYEIRLFEDCIFDEIVVFDMANVTLRDIFSASPRYFFRAFKVYKNLFSLRIKTMYFVNSPFYVTCWMGILKLVLSKKIYERFEVHRDDAVVKTLFESEDLPKDYGGEGPTLDDLNENLKKKLVEYQNRFDKIDTFLQK